MVVVVVVVVWCWWWLLLVVGSWWFRGVGSGGDVGGVGSVVHLPSLPFNINQVSYII